MKNVKQDLTLTLVYFLLFLVVIVFMVGCNNKVDTQVPAEIKVKAEVPETTQTVNVVHTIGLSVQMEAFFRTACTQQVDQTTPGLPEPQRTQAVDACVTVSSQQFINDFMLFIKQGLGAADASNNNNQ